LIDYETTTAVDNNLRKFALVAAFQQQSTAC